MSVLVNVLYRGIHVESLMIFYFVEVILLLQQNGAMPVICVLVWHLHSSLIEY